MARFDVYSNPGEHSKTTPYLLDVQTDLLDDLQTRVVVPLRDLASFANVTSPEPLMPVFDVQGRKCLMETPKIAAVPLRILKKPLISLAQEQTRILAAIDFLFHGY